MTSLQQVPRHKAARFAPIPSREKTGKRFHLVEEIVAAREHARRAEIVLRAPDGIVAQFYRELIQACLETRFSIGADYLAARYAAMQAMRTPDGLVRDDMQRLLEHWRVALVALSRGLVEAEVRHG